MERHDYADAPESTSSVSINPTYGLYIDGEFIEPNSKSYFTTINPANEEPLAEIAEADHLDVDRAVQAAARAFVTWSTMPGSERAKYIFRIARILQERAREFAVLETLDNGKPIRETRDFDIPVSVAHFFYHAGWADKLQYAGYGTHPEPLGVVGQIIPWNFPLMMLAWKIAPALATGNTVVLKPAETTPLTALLFADVLDQAGLPPGVVNIVTGAGNTGAALVEHPQIAKIAFTGSTSVGKNIMKTIAGTSKRLTLELGGKGANIIFDDAAIEEAIEGIINGIYFNQGHVCCAGSRLLVEESALSEVILRLQERMSTLRIGNPLDKNTDVGAINSKAQLSRIQDLVNAGVSEGAEIWSCKSELPQQGFWFAPSYFTNVTDAHRIVREEVFGPVLAIQTFRTPQEAVEKANNSPYGLSAGVWSEKASKVHFMASHLKAGVVWANTFNRFDPASPFGGYRESGFGREGGRVGLGAYLKEVAS